MHQHSLLKTSRKAIYEDMHTSVMHVFLDILLEMAKLASFDISRANFGLVLYVPVNRYGHVGTVNSHKHVFLGCITFNQMVIKAKIRHIYIYSC